MPGNGIVSLMGITVEHVQVKIVGSKLITNGPLLITHWGMSGPAILKLSAWAARELAEKKWQFGLTRTRGVEPRAAAYSFRTSS